MISITDLEIQIANGDKKGIATTNINIGFIELENGDIIAEMKKAE